MTGEDVLELTSPARFICPLRGFPHFQGHLPCCENSLRTNPETTRKVYVKNSTIQYTVRGVPQELERGAAKEHKSVNQVILDELTVALSGRRKHADFSDLVGCRSLDSELDEILTGQRIPPNPI